MSSIKFGKIGALLLFVMLSVSCLLQAAQAQQRLHVTPDGKTIYYIANNNQAYTSTLLLSNDNGQNFNPVTTIGATTLSAIYSLNSDNNTLYAGGFEESVKLTLNHSPTSEYLSHDYENFAYANLTAAYLAPDDKKIYLAGDDSDDDSAWLFIGTKQDDNNAVTWKEGSINNCGAEGYGTLNINAISGQGSTIYLASDTFNNNSPGVCISNDAGATWQIATGFPSYNAGAVYAAASNATVYASGFNYDANGAAQKTELYLSKNGGATWSATGFGIANKDPLITSITGSVDGSIIYVAATQNQNQKTKNSNNVSGGIWIKNPQTTMFQKVVFPDNKNYDITDISASANGKVVAAFGCYNDHGNENLCALWSSADAGHSWNRWDNKMRF